MYFLTYIESISIIKSSSRSQTFHQDIGLKNNKTFSLKIPLETNHPVQHSHFFVKDTFLEIQF